MLCGVTPEQLETRWVTAQGREILQRVIADLHDEGGLNLPAILGELEGTPEIQDGLDLRYAPLEGEHLEEVNLYAVNDSEGSPWLVAHLEDGTVVPISPRS